MRQSPSAFFCQRDMAQSDSASSCCFICLLCLSCIAYFVFWVFVCYALGQTTNDAVNAACGNSNLWNYMLANCILDPFIVFILVILALMSDTLSSVLGKRNDEQNYCATCWLYIFYSGYNAALFGLGIPIYQAAVSTPTCEPMLSSLNATGDAPLLTKLCLTYLIVGGFKMIMSFFFSFCAYCSH